MIMSAFKIPFVLVKNMTNKVILGFPFINALYPFLVEHDGITTDLFGQKVKFKFTSKFGIDTDNALNLIHAKNEIMIYSYMVQANQLLDFCPTFSHTFWQEKEHIVDINTISKWIKVIYTASRWNSMTSLVERKNKGKASA